MPGRSSRGGDLSAFAIASLLLGSVGVYAVISQSVRARTRETGLRVALGADSSSIARGVLRDGIGLGALGGAIGLAGGLLGSQLFGEALLHVSPLDPLAYLIVVPTLFLAVVAATLLPAMTAARMDPAQALRDRI